MSEQMFRVFKRRPWRKNAGGQWEPHGGAHKTTVREQVTREEARRVCAEGNKNNERGKPGQIWYEFESV